MIMKANNGGEDFDEEESPFFPDVPLKFEQTGCELSDQVANFEFRTDSTAAPAGPKMLRRRLMDEIRNLAVAR